MSTGKVSIPLIPSDVPRSPMSPISQTPSITGAPPRIPFPMVFIMAPSPPFGILYGNSLTPVGWTNMELNGMIPIGSSAGVPVANTITAGAGISVVNGPNSITISAVAPGLVWQRISGNTPLLPGNGYICVAPGGALNLTLPVVSSLGDEIRIYLDGSTSFTIVQGAGQQIRYGNQQSTAGVFGSITSTAQGDSMHLVCSVADLRWLLISGAGNPTIV